MHSGVTVCRRCNLRNLAFHDIHCDSDIFVMHNRLDALGGKSPRKMSNPAIAGIAVMCIAAIGVIIIENVWHQDGAVAQQTKQVLSSIQSPVKIAKADHSL